MRHLLSPLLLIAPFFLNAQYGSFDAAAIKAARNTTTVVVLDGGGTPYDRMITEAIKGDWKFTKEYEFMTMADLAMMPIAPDRTYLMKVSRVDPTKFEGTFLMLVQGWKPKKGEALTAKDNAFTSIPSSQELASLLIDDAGMNERNTTAMLRLYVRHLQDYLKLVEGGKITDKATADRTYASRTRLVRDGQLWVAKEHLDKSIPDAAKAKESYSAPFQVVDLQQLVGAIEKQDRSIAIGDMILTVGDHKNKHCFKRVFNAATGELMYLRDDAAVFGKKEGFIEEDLKAIERAR
jgi:hypothetical protein